MGTRNMPILIWWGSHCQQRKYPLRVPTMQYYCFDSTYQLLYHPIREQTSQLVCAVGHRPDGKKSGRRDTVLASFTYPLR